MVTGLYPNDTLLAPVLRREQSTLGTSGSGQVPSSSGPQFLICETKSIQVDNLVLLPYLQLHGWHWQQGMTSKACQKPWFCPGAVPGDLALTCPGEDTWLPPCALPVCGCQAALPHPRAGGKSGRPCTWLTG